MRVFLISLLSPILRQEFVHGVRTSLDRLKRFIDHHQVNLRPLIFIALLALLYWDAPRLVPHTIAFARRTILLVSLLVFPFLLYATVFRLAQWPHQTKTEMILVGMGALGMFVGLICGAICLFNDARRSP
jgi:Co/Zn/Cd efflux system component